MEIRPASTEDEIEAIRQVNSHGFHFEYSSAGQPEFRAVLEPERTCCAFDDGQMVGTSGAYTLDLSVPGGSLQTGGTTLVSVLPTHRRRGVLRAMMEAHFADVRERGEPLAALWASESVIYRRFGYGRASELSSVSIERAHAAFAEPVEAQGRLRLIEDKEVRQALPEVYDRVVRERPGHFTRSEVWWESRRLFDPRWQRDGATPFRYALYEESGRAEGYAQYRVKSAGDDTGLQRGAVRAVELLGTSPRARAALWQYLLGIDLVERLYAWSLPADHELGWLIADPRRIETRSRDNLWLRVMDVPAALAGRAYSREDRLTLAVRDSVCPWNDGCFELEGGPEGARCKPTSAEPELTIDAFALGAAFLGGASLVGAARAGFVRGEPDAVRRADAMFGWRPLPWCPEIF